MYYSKFYNEVKAERLEDILNFDRKEINIRNKIQMQRNPPFFSIEKSIILLKDINGISVSSREIDTIACLLSGKGVKSIAAFLSLSPRTIEAYIRTMTIKFGCNSREGIIEFVEKSPQFLLLKNYYIHLLEQKTFEKSLREITAKLCPSFSLVFCEAITPEANTYQLLQLLSYYTELTGIKVEIEENKQTSLSSPLPIVGLISRKEAEKNTPFLYVLVRDSSYAEIPQAVDALGYIDFGVLEELEKFPNKFYVAFFDLLQRLFPSIAFDSFQALSQQQNMFDSDLIKKKNVTLDPMTLLSDKGLKFLKNKKSLFYAISLICLFTFTAFYYPFQKNPTVSIHSHLPLPHQKALLSRSRILQKIENAFKSQDSGIKNLMLVGAGGSGKTTLARLYARSSENYSLVWEINAETKESILLSFKSLAYALSKTSTHKNDLEAIQKNSDSIEREKQLLLFIKNRLREESSWLLVYDNVETLSEIKDFIPDDSKAWGGGEVLFTTRDVNSQNTNYIDPESVIILDTLSREDAQTLLTQILYESSQKSLSSAQEEEIQQFLQHIPNYPLDIALAGHYVKNTKISLTQYLKRIQNFTEEWDQAQAAFLKDSDHYIKTRYHIVQTSLEKVINANSEFYSLLVLLCLLNHQEIPKDLINLYQ